MKTRFKIFLLFCIIGSCSISSIDAQTEQNMGILRLLTNAAVLDSANIQITYSLVFVPDSSKMNETLNDRKVLLIGNSVQHFYSYYSRFVDSIVTAQSKKGGNERLPDFPDKVCAEWYNIYNNYPEGKQTVVEHITTLQMHVYKEDLADFPKWNITTETLTILNYFCYKAVCYYHGRIWEAWFTMDIPINAGPWKLRGLPGLILKANDSRQHYVFECIGIEKLKHPVPILLYENAVNSIHSSTREKYLKALNQFYDNYVNTALSMGFGVFIQDDSGKIIEYIEPTNNILTDKGVAMSIGFYARDRYKKIPYNPIELE